DGVGVIGIGVIEAGSREETDSRHERPREEMGPDVGPRENAEAAAPGMSRRSRKKERGRQDAARDQASRNIAHRNPSSHSPKIATSMPARPAGRSRKSRGVRDLRRPRPARNRRRDRTA